MLIATYLSPDGNGAIVCSIDRFRAVSFMLSISKSEFHAILMICGLDSLGLIPVLVRFMI